MNSKFITKLQGKEFVLFEGLLDEFHNNGGKSIETEIISSEPFVIQATVKGEKGTYQGIGDADDKNCNRLIINHKIRMAETRAIARALRWYNNIGMCSADELGGDTSQKPKNAPVSDDKTKIKQLCDELNPILETKVQYEEFVMNRTGFELIPVNYKNIINHLTK